MKLFLRITGIHRATDPRGFPRRFAPLPEDIGELVAVVGTSATVLDDLEPVLQSELMSWRVRRSDVNHLFDLSTPMNTVYLGILQSGRMVQLFESEVATVAPDYVAYVRTNSEARDLVGAAPDPRD